MSFVKRPKDPAFEGKKKKRGGFDTLKKYPQRMLFFVLHLPYKIGFGNVISGNYKHPSSLLSHDCLIYISSFYLIIS